MIDSAITTVPNSSLIYVAITGPSLSGARGHLHTTTRRLVYRIVGGDNDTTDVILGQSVDELRADGCDYIAVSNV